MAVITLCLLACFSDEARATDTGWKTTGTIVSSGSWSNFTTTRLNTSDNFRASVSFTGSYGVCSTYGFSIPSGATIDGIEVQVEGRSTAAFTTAYYGVSLSWNNGSSWVTEKTGSFNSTSDATDTYGSSSDTWGRSWTDTEFSNANFRFRIEATSLSSTSLEVDFIQIRVYYTVVKTWDGGASTNNWGDGSNWNPDGVPISTENVNLTGANTIDVNAAGVCNNITLNNASLVLTIKSGQSLTASGSLTLTAGTLKTENAFPTVTGTVNVAAGTVEYSASSGTQTVSAQTYNNLTLSGGGTKTMPGTAFQVGGNFVMSGTPSATAAAALTVNGDFTIGSGCTFGGGSYTHNLGGSFTNNGTFTASTSTVNFTGAVSTTISGSSTTTFNKIRVNKGTSSASVLEATSVIGMASGGLTLTNGTFKVSSSSTITVFTADITTAPYLVPGTAGLWVNGGTVSTTSDVTAAGLIRVSSGTLNIGNAVNLRFMSSWATVIIEGGAFNVSGRFTDRVAGEGTYFTMSGGTLTVATVGSTSGSTGPFTIDNVASSFTMSGGTIVVRRPGITSADYVNPAGTTNVTGGTLQMGDASTPAGQTLRINSTAPIWNLTVNSTNAPTVQLVTNALTVKHDVTISGGTLNANNLNLTVGGDWTNNSGTSAFTAGSATVTCNGTSTQAIGGSYSTTFNNLTLNNSNGLTLNASATVSATLTFTSGKISTGSYSLIIPSTGTVSRTSGHVVGNFQKYIATGATSKTFEIGDASNYTPVNVAFGNVSVAGNLTAKSTAGDHANIGSSTIDASKSVNRYWTLTNSGITFTNYSATFTFVSGDVDGGASTSSFIVGKYSAGWTYPTVGTKTSTSTQATGLTSFGDFQLGEKSPKTWDGGASTTNWGDANNWNPDGVPTSSDDVGLTGANTIDVNVAGVCNSLALNNTSLVLTVKSGNSLTVSGNLTVTTGTLNTEASFPTVSGTTTLTAGTVGYTAASGSQTVAVQSYANLTISGGGTKTLGGTITPSGNLSVNGGTFDLGSYTANRSTAGGTLTVANGATLKIGGTNGFPSNYSTHTLGSTSTVEYSGANQTASNESYGHLTLSGSGTKTTTGATVNGILSMEGTATASAAPTYGPSATLQYNTATDRTAGPEWVTPFTATGGVIITGSSPGSDPNTGIIMGGAKVFSDGVPLTITSTGKMSTGNLALTFGGDAINNGPKASVGSSSININGTGTQSIGGFTTTGLVTMSKTVGTATFTSAMNGAGLTINGSGGTLNLGSGLTHTFTGTWTRTNGTLDGGSSTLKIGGSISGTGGTFTAGTGTVEWNAAGEQTVGALNYYNLTLSNAGTKTFAAGTAGIANAFTIGGSATANTTANSVTINYNGSGAQNVNAITYYHLTVSGGNTKTAAGGVTVNGDLTIGSSTTFAGGSYTHTVQGSWSNSGAFTAGTSTVQFTGSVDATLTGPTTFNTLTINKSSSTNSLTLGNNISTATLTMTQGKLLTGSNAVTVTSDRTGNGLVIGTITRTHTFSASASYAFEGPYQTLTFASGGTLPTSVTVTTTLSSPGANDSMEPVNRYYTISQTGGSGFTYTLRLHYEDTEVSAPNSETSPPLQLWRRISAGPDVWERKGATASNTTSNWVEASGQVDVGVWTLSSRTVPNVVVTIAQNDTHPSPGQIVIYTITYNNNGDGPAGTVLITASAPPNTSYVSGNTVLNGVPKTDQSGDDEVTVAGSTITINLGTVAAGATGTITYKVAIQ